MTHITTLFSSTKEDDLLDELEEIHVEAKIVGDKAAMFLSDIGFALSIGDASHFDVDLYKLQCAVEKILKDMRGVQSESIRRIHVLQTRDD